MKKKGKTLPVLGVLCGLVAIPWVVLLSTVVAATVRAPSVFAVQVDRLSPFPAWCSTW